MKGKAVFPNNILHYIQMIAGVVVGGKALAEA